MSLQHSISADIIEVRTIILASYSFPKFYCFYNKFKELLQDYFTKPALTKNIIQKIFDSIDPTRGLYSFFLFLQDNPSISIPISNFQIFFQTPLTLFEKIIILTKLWHYGEKWDDLSFQFFATSKFASDLKQLVQTSFIYVKGYSIDTQGASHISRKKYYQLLNAYDNLKLDEVFSSMAGYLTNQIELACLFSKSKKSTVEFFFICVFGRSINTMRLFFLKSVAF